MLRVLWQKWNVDTFGMWQVLGKFPEIKNLVKTKYEIENAQNLIWSTNLLLTTKGILAWQYFTRFVFVFLSAVMFTYLGWLLSVGFVRFAHIPSTQQSTSDVNITASQNQNKSCLHWQANPFLGKS